MLFNIRMPRILLACLVGCSLSGAGASYQGIFQLVADPANQLPAITYWLMGSLSGAHINDVRFVAIPMGIGLIPLLLLRYRMNLLTVGDAQARTMGVPVQLIRFVIILCSTLVTASAVAVSGTIGWIGLVIPHFSRHLVGNNYRRLMPASMLMGALFLLLVDDVSRNLLSTEIPLGILTAFIGAPFFLYLIIKGGEGV